MKWRPSQMLGGLLVNDEGVSFAEADADCKSTMDIWDTKTGAEPNDFFFEVEVAD